MSAQTTDRQSGLAALDAQALFRACDLGDLPFRTTAELEPLDGIIGQPRALEAVRFGLGIRRDNFNIFVLGPPGTGRKSVVERFTAARAESETTPPDWLYVFNFAEPARPRVLSVPAGRGAELRQAMRDLIEQLRAAIPAAFETEEYRARRQVIDEQLKRRHEEVFARIEREAREHNIALVRTPLGMGLAPMKDGEVLAPEEFRRLPADEQERAKQRMNDLQERLQEAFRQVPQWESERHEKIRELNREVLRFAIGHLIARVKEPFRDLPGVVAYLETAERDMVENADQLLAAPAGGAEMRAELPTARGRGEGGFLDRYQVNLLVDRTGARGAPIVVEDHPTLPNLVGRIEYRPQFGALVTDFSLIKRGALHQANGGYLVLDARRVLMQPFAWEGLKRVLLAREIRIESIAEMTGLISTETLQPETIPVNVKLILIGDRVLYYLLCALDPDFPELFKVAADFDDRMARDREGEQAYARLIASLARRGKLRPLDRQAVARTIEHAARIAGDSERLSAEIETVADLLREADFLAGEAGREVTLAGDVENAIQAQIRRASRLRDRLREEIGRGTIMIETAGARVGQINGLSVLSLGGFSFGHPSRITARVRLGKGEVLDIEREVDLGGPIHSKGVMILTGFLGGRFALRRPLTLSASLAFEQSYAGVEGDSASLAELCALLSALSGAAIRQGFAVTGSVNQHGDVQAIGGVNEKIEGFFDVCTAAGLDGGQGVIIPHANAKHLMLRRDVVEAAAAGRFRVHGVRTVDEAIELLTGVPAGGRGPDGAFPSGSVNARVEAELAAMAEAAQRFAARGEGEKKP